MFSASYKWPGAARSSAISSKSVSGAILLRTFLLLERVCEMEFKIH